MNKTLAKMIRVLTYIGGLSLLGMLIQYAPLLTLQVAGHMMLVCLLLFIVVLIPFAFEAGR